MYTRNTCRCIYTIYTKRTFTFVHVYAYYDDVYANRYSVACSRVHHTRILKWSTLSQPRRQVRFALHLHRLPFRVGDHRREERKRVTIINCRRKKPRGFQPDCSGGHDHADGAADRHMSGKLYIHFWFVRSSNQARRVLWALVKRSSVRLDSISRSRSF